MTGKPVDTPPINKWKTLDKDLGRIGRLEMATQYVARPLVAPGLALAFVVVVEHGGSGSDVAGSVAAQLLEQAQS